MSYNVVLNETIKFVDNIRNNGFIDKDAYYNYLSALASTSNTYKVEMEVYKKRLIRDIDSDQDTFLEEFELFNSKDILDVLDKNSNQAELENTNIKNNVYLLNENDEVYFKVYNTNETAGSVIYKAFAGTAATKIIDISYGGIVKNVDWELYNKLDISSVNIPEVFVEVPVNANNETNIMKLDDASQSYTYLYNLTQEEDTMMTIAVQLKNITSIVVGENADGSMKLAELNELDETQFNNAKDYIISKFIELNEMIANVDLVYRQSVDGNYTFNIVLEDIQTSSVIATSTFASVSILPGLGQDTLGNLSLGTESVKVELVN